MGSDQVAHRAQGTPAFGTHDSLLLELSEHPEGQCFVLVPEPQLPRGPKFREPFGSAGWRHCCHPGPAARVPFVPGEDALCQGQAQRTVGTLLRLRA